MMLTTYCGLEPR